MKKLMMIAALMLMCVGASAQEKGLKCLGADFSYAILGHEMPNRVAIGAKAQYNVTAFFRAEVDFKLYPKKDGATFVNPNLNLQYLFRVGDSERFFVYPTLGGGLIIWNEDVIDNQNLFSFQGGVGTEYHITEKFKLFLEATYQHAKKDNYKWDGAVLAFGGAYYF